MFMFDIWYKRFNKFGRNKQLSSLSQIFLDKFPGIAPGMAMTLFLVLCVFISLTTVIVSLRDHIIYTSDPDFTVDLTKLELLEF